LGNLRGHTITIETPTRTLPAGWYTDPAKSGGKRWWDGTKWTEHLKMPEKPAPTAAAAHGETTVHHGYDTTVASLVETTTADNPTLRTNDWVSWVALLFGFAAIALTFVPSLPGSTALWVGGAGVGAVLCGLFAILRRMRRLASNLWAPVVGILFGLGATAIALFGVNVVDLVVSVTGGSIPTSSQTTSTSVAPPRPVSHEPFVFAAKPALTADGVAVQQIATAINRTYAAGNSALAAGQSWPIALKFTPTQVLDASGSPLVTVAPGHVFTYHRAADLRSYTVTVSSGDPSESAVYNSAADRFTYLCPATDASCVPTH
jgi:hypothetical protein